MCPPAETPQRLQLPQVRNGPLVRLKHVHAKDTHLMAASKHPEGVLLSGGCCTRCLLLEAQRRAVISYRLC